MRLAAAALTAGCLASACGGTSTHAQGGAASAPAAQAPPPGGACASGARSLCLTAAARGRTVTIAPGWTLTLKLAAPGRSFGVPAQRGAALRQLGPATRSDGSVSVAYRALRRGSVQLRAPERARCRTGAVCPQFVVLWTLNVRVAGRVSPTR